MSDTLVFDRIQSSLIRLRLPIMGEIWEGVMQAADEKALQIQPFLAGGDQKWNETVKTAYIDLVDHFYRENEQMMAPHQCEGAKEDFEYFMVLVELAIAYHWEEEDKVGNGVKME
jgi:hypothetical protein